MQRAVIIVSTAAAAVVIARALVAHGMAWFTNELEKRRAHRLCGGVSPEQGLQVSICDIVPDTPADAGSKVIADASDPYCELSAEHDAVEPEELIRHYEHFEYHKQRFSLRYLWLRMTFRVFQHIQVPLSKFVPVYRATMRKGHPYVNTASLCRTPCIRAVFLEELCQLVQPGVTCIVAFELRAIIWGVLIANHLKLKFIPARVLEHLHGANLQAWSVSDENSYRNATQIGIDISAFRTGDDGDKVAIFDDVKSSGSTLKCIDDGLRSMGIKVVQRFCLVDFSGDNADKSLLKLH
jgi:adenine/guanine phosphoribosyltransferase-like PRPP-binding protein